MQYDLFSTYNYKFFSLGSGSSGNCYFLGTKDYGILIDAGIGIRSILKILREYGVSLDKIQGVLVTHDHADHVKTIGCLGDKYNIPVYATEAVHGGIERNRYIQPCLGPSKRFIRKDEAFKIRDFDITAFDVPHDSIENVGYHIRCENQVFVLITDIGRITETIRHYAMQANHLVIETNYDEEMLRTGRYPFHLKQRISSGMGHISNHLTADFIADIYHRELKSIWLCHLSQDNNHPDLAYKAVEQSLRNIGIIAGKDIYLSTLNRHKASGLREF